MSTRVDDLHRALEQHLAGRTAGLTRALGELTLVVEPADLLSLGQLLRDAPELRFEQLIDLSGLDYLTYKDGAWSGRRYAVVAIVNHPNANAARPALEAITEWAASDAPALAPVAPGEPP